MHRDLASVQALLEQRDLRSARAALSAVLSARPDDPEAADLEAELLLLERSPQRALEAARRAIGIGTESAARLDRLGRCLNNLGDPAAAEQAFRRALSVDPGRADTHVNLGHVLRRQRRSSEAEKALLTALGIQPDHLKALRALGMLHLASGRPDEAAKRLRRAVELAPDQPGLRGYLGIALHQSGDLQGAEEAYRQALAIDAEDVDTWMNLGITLQDRGRLDDAISAYEEAGSRDPGLAAPRHRLAEALLAAERPEQALQEAERANALDPGDPTGVALRIAALQAIGRGAEAEELLGLNTLIRAVDLEPPPAYPDVRSFNDALAAHVLEHPTLSYEPTGHATRRGRHTRDLLVGEKGPVAHLETQVLAAVDAYLEALQVDAGHPFPGPVPEPHRLTMWAVVMEAEGHQLPHIHPAAWLSGVYYVELPETLGRGGEDVSGWIEFGLAPDELRPESDMPNRLLRPAEGRIFLFPSYLYHQTVPFPGDHRRISIAFDLLRRPGS